MAEKTNGLSILISTAMTNIGSLATDKRNEHDKYDYISSDKVLEEIGKSLGDLGVTVIPGVTNVVHTVHQRDQGKVMFQADVFMQMTVKEGEEEITVPWYGCGVDYRVPDKAVYKAITSGHSYFLRKLLMVGVGNEDGEHEPYGDYASGSSSNVPAGEVRVNFPKAKELFGGKAPTVVELFAKDPEYCDWMYKKGKGESADAMREFIDTTISVDRKAKDSGIPVSGAEMIDAVENIETILAQTTGDMSPTQYWTGVRSMGIDEHSAQDISSACEGDWRLGLQMAVDALRGKK